MIDLDYQTININLKSFSTEITFDVKMDESETNKKLSHAFHQQIAIGVNVYPGIPFFVMSVSPTYLERGGFINYVLSGKSE